MYIRFYCTLADHGTAANGVVWKIWTTGFHKDHVAQNR